jgi:spermidine synthase
VADDVQVTVAELVPELVLWNRLHLTALHDSALDDPRCDVVLGDVFDTIKRSRATFDVILLDVDNGPVALSQENNQRLYSEHGVRVCLAALRPYGVLAVWSAGPSPRFERRLQAAGFEVEVLRVAARQGSRARHVLFLATRRAASISGNAAAKRRRRR